MSDVAITFAILIAVVIAFISNRIPVGLVAIGAALALYFTGVLDLTQAPAGFVVAVVAVPVFWPF